MRHSRLTPGSLDITWLTVLFVIGFGLRGPGIIEKCLWSDEVVAIGYNAGAFLPDLAKILTVDIHPPLFYLLQRFSFDMFGVHPLTLRLIPLFAGIVAPLWLFTLVRRRCGFSAAVAGSLFLALSPLHISWSQTGRMYAPLVLAAIFLLDAVSRLDEGDERGSLLVTAAFLVGGLLDWPFLLLIPPVLLHGWWTMSRSVFRRLVVAVLAAILLMTPVFCYSIGSRLGNQASGGKFLQTEMVAPPATALLDTLAEFTAATDFFPLRIIFLLLLLPWFLGLTRDQAERRLAGLALTTAVMPPLLLYLASHGFTAAGYSPIYVDRAVLFSLGPLAVWYGFLISRIRRPWWIFLVCCSMACGLLFLHSEKNVKFMDRGWREDSAFLKKHGRDGDVLYLAPWFAEDEFYFYQQGPVHPLRFSAEDFGVGNYLDMFRNQRVSKEQVEAMLTARLQGRKRVWYLEKDLECALGDGHRFDHDQMVHDWLRSHYRLARHHVSAFPNGQGRHDLWLYSQEPPPVSREKSLSVVIDARRLPGLSVTSLRPLLDLSFDGAKMTIPAKEFDYDQGSTARLTHFRFLDESTFEVILSRLRFDEKNPLPANDWIAWILTKLRVGGLWLTGKDLFELGRGPEVSGEGDQPIIEVIITPQAVDDPFLRAFVFLLSVPMPFALLGYLGWRRFSSTSNVTYSGTMR